MSIKEQVEQLLTSAAQQAENDALPAVGFDTPVGRMTAELAAVDQLACAFERLALTGDALDEATFDELQAVAADLSTRLSYLLEPVQPIEADSESCIVQMRSQPPETGKEGARFYELVVSREALTLSRYAKRPGRPRERIAAEVTREVLGRLAGDLVAALS